MIRARRLLKAKNRRRPERKMSQAEVIRMYRKPRADMDQVKSIPFFWN